MKYLSAIVLGMCLVAISCNQADSKSGTANDSTITQSKTFKKSSKYRDITVDELDQAFGDKDYVLIDVRTPEEIANGMIEGSKHIDFVSSDFKDQIKQLDRNANYVIYCRSGGRSTKTCKMMQKQGFKNVANLDGGYLAYTDSQ